MKVFAALVWREVLERRLLLVASVFLGLTPVLLPWVPGRPEQFAPEDVRTAAVLVLGVLFGGATLVILGSTIVVRDLSEGRLGFFFSRPVPVGVLWSSRLAAAALLFFASLLLLLAPTAIVDFESWTDQLTSGESGHAQPFFGPRMVYATSVSLPPAPPAWFRWTLALTAIVVLLVAAHAVSTVIRARSLWVLLDLAGLALVGWIGWLARDRMVREEALGGLVHAEWVFLPWILVSLLIAGTVQLDRGRTDLQLGHRYLSATLWPLLLAGALGLGGYSWWIAASEIEDLESVKYAKVSRDDRWLVTGGPVRHRSGAHAAFLSHAESGRSWRLGGLDVTRSFLTFSGDSGTVLWARCESFVPLSCRLWAKDLRDVASPPEPIDVPGDRIPNQIVLSHDGRRMAAAESGRVVVYEVPSGNLVAAVDAKQPTWISFISADRVRFQELIDDGTTWTARIRHFDLASRQVVDAGFLPGGRTAWHSPYGDRVLYSAPKEGGYGLFDSADGRLLAELGDAWKFAPKRAQFLSDGRLVLAVRERYELTLMVFSREGPELFRIERSQVAKVAFGGELSPGRLMVSLRETERDATWSIEQYAGVVPLTSWTTYVLDLESRELSRLAYGLVPLSRYPVAAGDARVFASRSSIVRWNPASGEPEKLVAPKLGLEYLSRLGDFRGAYLELF